MLRWVELTQLADPLARPRLRNGDAEDTAVKIMHAGKGWVMNIKEQFQIYLT